MDKQDKQGLIKEIMVSLLSTGVLLTGFLWVYNNFLVSPAMRYNDDTGVFTVQADFRGVSMRVYPQMIIRFKNTVILVTHLGGYLESEMIQFNEKEAVIVKDHQEYCDRLLSNIRKAVLRKLQEVYGADAVNEISKQFEVSVSFICGVQYQAPLGNKIRKYCIIEHNGLLVDYLDNMKKVEQRLYEYEIELSDNLETIYTSSEVKDIVSVVAAEIGRLYEDNA